jgi:maltose alpha-D-glucosyltransferase/alpha-amylase
MIRSIDYAAAAAVRAAADLPSVDKAALERCAADWRDRSIAAFLSAYRSTSRAPPAGRPTRPAPGTLIELMLIDKALYEIGYELANRPAWLGIPIPGSSICP